MRIELIIAIEPLSTEATFWVPFEPALVYSSRMVVSKFFMFSQILLSEQFVLVCKDLLISCAQITQDLVVDTPDMTM